MYLRQEKCAVQLGHAAAPHEQHEPHQCELPKPVYTRITSDVPGITVSGGSIAYLHVQCFPVQVRRHVL